MPATISTFNESFCAEKIATASAFDISLRTMTLSSTTIFFISASIFSRSSGVKARPGSKS